MRGKLIVFEGTDGSGKATQTALLCRELETRGVPFRKLEFPRYGEESSALLRLYLNGAFGTDPADVNAYAAATFYSVDRFASYKQDWGGWYEQGGLVIADRYTTSNAVHQTSKLLFMITSPVFHASRYIQPGVYELNTDMDFNCLIKSMQPTGGVAATVTVTIPEGYTVEQIIQLLAENDVSDAAALEESAKNHVFDKFDFVDNKNLGSVSRLEGYLFPDTYEFYVKENADSALSRLLSNFQDRIMDDPDIAPLIANSSYSLKEIVIMASLIEKETDGTDRAVISSVIHNRLENVGETAHLLQIDASLVYAAGREITEDDFQTLDSPYNLYTHQGLPPTAIANAGKASIVAALKPDKTNYYFYVLNPDTQRHVFSRTLTEHNANLRKFG